MRTENLRRARRRLRQMQIDYARGRINRQQISQSLQSWVAHLKHGNTQRLRRKIFATLVFARE